MAAALTIDGYRYTQQDARRTIRILGDWWQQLAEGRVLPTGFGELVAEQRRILLAGGDDPTDDPTSDVGDLMALAGAVYLRAETGDVDTSAVLTPSLELIRQAGELLRATRGLPSTARGELVQVNLSDGGVPKRPVDAATIGLDGLAGDRQAARQHHGRPWQAVCLWATEVVDQLAASGHPIFYGACGENLSIRGLTWPEVRPGVRLQVGPVLLEATPFAAPCTKNARWFADHDSSRIHHQRGPLSRIYASVLEPGTVTTGDEVVLEPAS